MFDRLALLQSALVLLGVIVLIVSVIYLFVVD